MDNLAAKVQQAVGTQRKEIVAFLKELVQINTYSGNPKGINRVGEIVASRMPARLSHRVVNDYNGVNHHIFINPGSAGQPIIIVGHLDTVFPPDSEFKEFTESEEKLSGPGTADMKGGIVVMVFALNILEELKILENIPLRCLINGDEETGSGSSYNLIRDLAPGAAYGLVFECGGLEGEVVKARRGIRRYKLSVTGKARHAGVKGGPKASAVVEVSQMVLAFEDLNDLEKGISVNVGRIRGGTVTNMVPDHAVANFEFRFWNRETEDEVLEKIKAIVNNPQNPECTAVIECDHRRPAGCPVDGTDHIYKMVKTAAKELGQKVGQESRGGTSDANFLTDEGIPTLDGMGPVGDMDHSPDEYIVKESLFERIALTAVLLHKLAAGG
ncbi:MAG: M20 family metallopeptidase [bacterium]